MAGDVPDTSQRISANLACTLRNVICHDEDLVGLFIKQQMVIAEVPASGSSKLVLEAILVDF
jgi:hypothetical protein